MVMYPKCAVWSICNEAALAAGLDQVVDGALLIADPNTPEGLTSATSSPRWEIPPAAPLEAWAKRRDEEEEDLEDEDLDEDDDLDDEDDEFDDDDDESDDDFDDDLDDDEDDDIFYDEDEDA